MQNWCIEAGYVALTKLFSKTKVFLQSKEKDAGSSEDVGVGSKSDASRGCGRGGHCEPPIYTGIGREQAADHVWDGKHTTEIGWNAPSSATPRQNTKRSDNTTATPTSSQHKGQSPPLLSSWFAAWKAYHFPRSSKFAKFFPSAHTTNNFVRCEDFSSKDPYRVLGLSRGASTDDIRRAYKKLAVKHHPDKGGDQEAFKNITRAYETLSDPKQKQAYDQYGDASGDPFSGMGGGPGGGSGTSGGGPFYSGGGASGPDPFGNVGSGPFGFGTSNDPFGQGSSAGSSSGIFGDDPFEAFTRMGFEEFAANGRQRRQARVPKPVVRAVNITLEQLCQRKTVTVEIPMMQKICTSCSGQGGDVQICGTCGGSGYEVRTRQFGGGYVQTQGTCSSCRGAGRLRTRTCAQCQGHGVKHATESFQLNLDPKTVEEGYTFRFLNRGSEVFDHATGGVLAGDVFIAVRFQTPPGRRDGGKQVSDHSNSASKSKRSIARYDHLEFERGPHHALYTKIAVPFADAICGDLVVEIKHPAGKYVTVALPSNLQHTDVVRVAGKGVLWDGNIASTGSASTKSSDLFVKLRVETPNRNPWSTPEEREALRQVLKREAGIFDVKRGGGKGGEEQSDRSDTAAGERTAEGSAAEEKSTSSQSSSSSWKRWWNRSGNDFSSSGSASSDSNANSGSSSLPQDSRKLGDSEKHILNRHLKAYKAERERASGAAAGAGQDGAGPGGGEESTCHVQ
ncbi:unnamed protein product [Amoebophrya sp. A120]|nr:unnamed protein product [Amoebophrya sp. A120]|eukprot:GSA120T00011945001.1